MLGWPSLQGKDWGFVVEFFSSMWALEGVPPTYLFPWSFVFNFADDDNVFNLEIRLVSYDNLYLLVTERHEDFFM